MSDLFDPGAPQCPPHRAYRLPTPLQHRGRDRGLPRLQQSSPELPIDGHRGAALPAAPVLRVAQVNQASLEVHTAPAELRQGLDAASPISSSPIRARSSRRTPCSPERSRPASPGTSSSPASRSRTESARHSTPGCGTSSSTRRCSSASTPPVSTSLDGWRATTTAGRTPRSATRPRRPMLPGSPHRAAGCARRKRSPSRPLLRQRKSAKTKRRLRFQQDDRRGSEQPEGSQDSVIRRKFQIQAPTVRGRSELNARGGS